MRALILLLVFSLLPRVSIAQEAPARASGDYPSAILYGANYAYLLSAPKGWVLDNSAGKPQGLQLVIYPTGRDWSSTPNGIYTATFDKPDSSDFASVVRGDSLETVQNSPGVRFTAESPILTDGGATAKVWTTRGDRWGNVDALAFIDQPHVVVVVVLTARSEEAFRLSWPAFVEAVKSYLPMEKQ